MLWIALVLLLALAAGVLGSVLELAAWAIALSVVGLVVVGLVVRRAVLPGPGRGGAGPG